MKPVVSVVFVACALSASSLRAQDGSATQTFALVVGSNRSPSSRLPRLRYADDDAVTTHKLLLEAGVTSFLLTDFDSDTRELYPDLKPPSATSAELERAVGQLADAVKRARAAGDPTEFVLFYSGHGDAEGGEGYVALESGRLERTRLYAILQRVGAPERRCSCCSPTAPPAPCCGRC